MSKFVLTEKDSNKIDWIWTTRKKNNCRLFFDWVVSKTFKFVVGSNLERIYSNLVFSQI